MKKIPKVIIIGAGMAGLAAAQELIAHKADVKIVEARNRYGGRIWIDHSMGVPLGRGATWMHGINTNPLRKLATKLHVPIVPFESDKYYQYDTHHKLIKNSIIKKFNTRFESALHKANIHAFEINQDVSLSEALSPYIFEPITAAEESLFQNKLKFFENYIGAEYEYLSARYWDEESAEEGEGIISDAYEKIILELSSNVPIEFNTIVNSVYRLEDEVKVITNQGEIFADSVIITVPLGVLKEEKILFFPPVSQKKQEAIHKLGMGLFNIVALKFPKVFWPEECHAFFIPNSITCSMFLNAKRFTQLPILLGYFGGKRGGDLEKESDSDLIDKTMASLRNKFGDKASYPESYFITRWKEDPFSCGSYSYLPIYSTPNDRDILAESETKQLFFAGEATMRQFPATVQGAYLSGMREAYKIKTLYGL